MNILYLQNLSLIIMHKFGETFSNLNAGACEGTLTCSTCHLIFPKEVYNNLPDEPSDEELDMLELAQELSETYVCFKNSFKLHSFLLAKKCFIC